MIEVRGKGCIVARVIADSRSSVNGQRITTFELEYNRFIHSELMTHRMFSRNAMSSRAIPVSKMIEQVQSSPATPIHWGANQRGMQAATECDNPVGNYGKEEWWALAALSASRFAEEMSQAGYHKQIINRLLEPFQIMKTVVTATEFDNFFYLRCHKDAQPEIKELAECMREAYNQSEAELLKPGEWHTPYVNHCDKGGEGGYYIVGSDGNDVHMDVGTALKVSASCCAQVSYRLLDNSVDKAVMIYDKLVESKPVHASPFEHQATPIRFPSFCDIENGWEEGVTHMDNEGNHWSGNLKGWIQYRQLIKGNVCDSYEENK